jgi:uncharacterized protein YdeI (YjbR/CyaY-like superfamily)
MNRLLLKDRAEFRAWLAEHALSAEGIWLVFGKDGGPSTIKADEALEEALCFGWIDGQIQSVDESSYLKYFKQRNESGNWSEKNKSLAEKLEERGLMTDFGRAKIEAAKQNGRWDSPKAETLSEEQFGGFVAMLRPHEQAYGNFTKMSRSVQRTYASSYYFGAKTEAGKQERLQTIIERLGLNLNPMESLKKKLEKAENR